MALKAVSCMKTFRGLVNAALKSSTCIAYTRNLAVHRFSHCVSLHQRTLASESKQFQARCRKIGAVVTKAEARNSKPIVALLGWNSAQDKHLVKYSDIYEKKGFDTVRISANPFSTMMFLHRAKNVAQTLLDILVEMKSDKDCSIIIHAFSMGGFNVYHFMRQAILSPGHQHFNSIHIIGCIFDSCPHFPSMHSTLSVQSSILQNIPNPLAKVVAWIGLGVAYPLAFLLSPHIKRLIPDNINSPLGCPELFLYSDADHLIPYDDVKTFLKAHEEKGINVFSKVMKGSAHVQHLRNYPEDYLNQINTFTDYCFKKDM
ncbi:Transmembrane protein 53 [Acropora cervicornis]|uniref:Transmembrane protein 53 n=1 Tax=Acropora cervicornis TaxID=6130 RepID=A0AAD9V2J7_ACRCE|nr:Transmembrane protein 53 [Acropora cervicornis]